MPLGSKLDPKIVSSPIYNLSLSLPFVCAFYIINVGEVISLPFGYEASGETSHVLHILSASFYYAVFIMFAALASHMSALIEKNKFWLIYVIFIFVISLLALTNNQDQPKISIYFTVLASIVLITVALKKHHSHISHIATTFLGAIASLLCFTSGILWYFDFYLFQDSIAALFGLQIVKPISMKVGAAMLISMGYVIYYGIFKLNEDSQ